VVTRFQSPTSGDISSALGEALVEALCDGVSPGVGPPQLESMMIARNSATFVIIGNLPDGATNRTICRRILPSSVAFRETP
jgi:hypothetical protein